MSTEIHPDSISLLTTADVAELLALAEITIVKMRQTGKGPRYVKIGRAVRYRPKDVARFITSLDEGGES